MVAALDDMLKTRLKLWVSRNKTYPENIMVYRDGVSEGQYDHVLDIEVPQLRKACEQVYPATDTAKGLPNLTVVVVGKRHHTRFYPVAEADADRSGNTKNGTIVDRGVTEAHNWDFFLQAHTALQGTARPAHYFIILDEIFTRRKLGGGQTAADVLEETTHNMCYLFGRATKSVSLCHPAYYADIVCERARCYMSGIFDQSTPSQSLISGSTGLPQVRQEDVRIHESLKDTMFYI